MNVYEVISFDRETGEEAGSFAPYTREEADEVLADIQGNGAQGEIRCIGTKVSLLLDNLALAFGGHSQYSTADIGRAIAGHINNQGWSKTPHDLAVEASRLLAERWKDGMLSVDYENILHACMTQLAEFGC